MNFLANENFPFPSIRILREKGFVVKSILEDNAGISDTEVLTLAQNENAVILTFDRDYGEIIMPFCCKSAGSSLFQAKRKFTSRSCKIALNCN